MATFRTQIYLTIDQRRELDLLAERDGATFAELIRLAVDEYLAARPVDVDSALSASFGEVPGAAAPSRSDWAARGKRLVA